LNKFDYSDSLIALWHEIGRESASTGLLGLREKPIDLLDFHSLAAFVALQEFIETTQFGFRHRLILGKGSHGIPNCSGSGLWYHHRFGVFRFPAFLHARAAYDLLSS
jgi:hypothetical protein